MGFAISWLAVKGKTPEALARELGLAPSGEAAEIGEATFTGGALPGGWFLLVMNRCEHEFVAATSLALLSRDCEVVACSIEEHVMVSTSELWRNGARVWRIEHDAQRSIDHISASGRVPDTYSAIEREFVERQNQAGGRNADIDYFFEIPLQMAKSIVGFKHDEARPEEESFETFRGASLSSERKPWWKVW